MGREILDDYKAYFIDKINKFGATPGGADYNSLQSQEIRFMELAKCISEPGDFSILDFGCGYGAMLGYLHENYTDMRYTGYDMIPEMIVSARENNKSYTEAIWKTELSENDTFDYTVACAIFNNKLKVDSATWTKHVTETLEVINKLSTKGFSFNMLTSYSDKEYMRDDLYYADPLFFFDYCKKNFSKDVALLHDYKLYDFTIIVRK
jgi:cyclopropane fatty-acyl-phospholipid synthase-like methyltransferase